MNAAAAQGIELPQHRDDVVARLQVAPRNFGAEVCLDEYGLLGVEVVDQRAGVRSQGVQTFGGGVDAAAEAAQQNRRGADRDHQRGAARPVVAPEARRVLAGGPVAASEQRDVQVEHRGGEGDEIHDAGQGQDAFGEVAELLDERKPFEQAAQAAGYQIAGMRDENGRGAEQRAQNVGHGQVRRQQRGDHAQRDERRAHQPVTRVSGEYEPEVGAAEDQQHDHVAQRESQRYAVDRHVRRVLAGHDLDVGGGQGQQQLVGAVDLFLRPRRHRDRRNQQDQQVWKPGVERVEVGQVVGEERFLPKRGDRAEKHEQRDENVTGRAAEIRGQLPPANGFGKVSGCHR